MQIHNRTTLQKKLSGVASTSLTIIVSRGNPPAPILVRCFKDGKHFLDFSSPGSFSHRFTDLFDGEYHIYITGFNRKDGADTTCFLSEDEIRLIEPVASPIKCETPAYMVCFHFMVE